MSRTRWLAALAVAASVAFAPTPARARGFSMGLAIGETLGFTLRGEVSPRGAIEGLVGFDLFPGDALVLSANYTWDAYDFLKGNGTASLWFYLGGGAKFEWLTDRYFAFVRSYRHRNEFSQFGFGPQGVLGLRASWHTAPFDAFAEIAPVGLLVVVPDPAVFYDLDFTIGFRYRF